MTSFPIFVELQETHRARWNEKYSAKGKGEKIKCHLLLTRNSSIVKIQIQNNNKKKIPTLFFVSLLLVPYIKKKMI